MPKVQLSGYRCERCEHEWLPRDKGHDPKVCPKCKSPYWDRPRRAVSAKHMGSLEKNAAHPNGGMPESSRKVRARAGQARESREWSEVSARIMSFDRRAGWLGRGSLAIRKSACVAAIEFLQLARTRCAGLAVPRAGPSVSGAVALQWKFDDVHFMVHLSSRDARRLYYQREGPGWSQEHAILPRNEVIAKLQAAFDHSRT